AARSGGDAGGATGPHAPRPCSGTGTVAGATLSDSVARHPDPTDEAVLTTLVTLGRTLGLAITAEGVETAIQARRLRAIGRDLGQGWYFSHPQPDHRLTRLIAGDRVNR